MNAYWVADNIKPQNKVELFFLFCSVYFWKLHNPNTITHIITDSNNIEYYAQLELWDNVQLYNFSNKYPKGTDQFWAIGKLDAMQSFKTPFCILDLDMFYTEPICFSGNSVIFAFLEDGWNYYPNNQDPILKASGVELFSKNDESANVSFLYISNESVKTEYAKTALNWATKLSTNEFINGSHMILCEQKLLMDIIHRDSLTYNTLIKPIFKCYAQQFLPKLDDFTTNYFHLGTFKKKMRNDELYLLELQSKIFKIIYERYPAVAKEYVRFKKRNGL